LPGQLSFGCTKDWSLLVSMVTAEHRSRSINDRPHAHCSPIESPCRVVTPVCPLRSPRYSMAIYGGSVRVSAAPPGRVTCRYRMTRFRSADRTATTNDSQCREGHWPSDLRLDGREFDSRLLRDSSFLLPKLPAKLKRRHRNGGAKCRRVC